MTDAALVEVERANGVATLWINRPERRNALDDATRDELIDALDAASVDPEIRVVVISGRGGEAFASGADLAADGEIDAMAVRRHLQQRRIYDAVAECARPVVAMIDGVCLGGGCELALACDLRIASRRSRFGQPEIRLGLIPGGGGTQRLPRAIGLGQAMRLVLTGAVLDADEAQRLGLVELVVDDDQLLTATRELCVSMAAHSPLALGLAKQAVRASAELPLGTGLSYERELFTLALASDDAAEGIASFRERRPPVFRGR